MSSLCKKLYITEILQEFLSDAFFPEIDQNVYSLLQYALHGMDENCMHKTACMNVFREHDDPLIPGGIVEENNIKYKFTVYQRMTC